MKTCRSWKLTALLSPKILKTLMNTFSKFLAVLHIVTCICKKQQCIIIFRSSQIRGILSVAKLLTNASLFIFDWIIKVAGNKDMHKSLQEFDFWHIQTVDIVELIGPEKQLLSYLKTIQNILMTLLDGSQSRDCCPLGYLFVVGVYRTT